MTSVGMGSRGSNWSKQRVSCQSCPHRADEWCAMGDEMSLLDDAKTCNVYKPGQVIFYQGNPCLGLYCIREGTVALRKGDAHGNEVIVRLTHEGETLGARTFFAEGKYTSAAVALTTCRICFVDRPMLDTLLDRNPEAARVFLKNISKALHKAEEDKLHFATLSVRQRLVQLLLQFRDKYGEMDEEGILHIQLPLSRQDIASMIATRPETLSRTIRALEKDGVAEFKKRKVLVEDLDALFDELEMAQA